MDMNKETILQQLSTVVDPELSIDIVTLGLIYDVSVSDKGDVYIKMTHTTPLCPYGGEITRLVKEAVFKLHPKSLKIEITFDPPWEPPAGLRETLGV